MAELAIGKANGKRFELPRTAVTQKAALLGRTGSGKSYGATKLAEEMLAGGAQVVALDPVGIWWGLRLAADGQKKGIEIPVFGGLHGDIPLVPTSGALIADLVVDRRLSVILDVSQFESDKEKARFASDFADRFFRRMKAAPAPVHVFLEECQEFVPQNPADGEAMMLHYWTRLAKLGRNFGIGLSLITQRPQEVNKKVLNMTELLLAFQMTGTQERKAIKEWLGSKGSEQDGDAITDFLRELPVGSARVSSPQWLKFEGVVEIGKKWTYDSSSTPDFESHTAPVEVAPLNLGELQEAMAATIEQAEASDPKKLQARIRKLERELEEQAPAGPNEEEIQERIREAEDELQAKMETVATELAAAAVEDAIGALRNEVRPALDTLQHVLSNGWQPPALALPTAPAAIKAAPRERPAVQPRPRPAPTRPAPRGGAGSQSAIGKGERIILTAIAQHDAGVSREQLSVLTAYKRSSRDTYLQKLGAAGLIQFDGGTIRATQAGVVELGDDFEPLPTGDALRAYWLQKLSGGERVILEAVCQAYPEKMQKSAIDEATSYQRSSRDTFIQKLSARRLVHTDRAGVRASDELFTRRRTSR